MLKFFARSSWYLPRNLYYNLARILNLPTLPPLRDEVELLLLIISIYHIFYPENSNTLVYIYISTFLIHIVRGVRIQLTLLYLSIVLELLLCFSFVEPNNISQISNIILIVMTIFCTINIPMLPPIMSSVKSDISVKDICLQTKDGFSFWIRIFYPACNHNNSAKKKLFHTFVSFKHDYFLIELCISVLVPYILKCLASNINLNVSHYIISQILILLVHRMLLILGDIKLSNYLSNFYTASTIKSIANFSKIPKILFHHLSYYKICASHDELLDINTCKINDNGLQLVIMIHGLGGCRSVMSQSAIRFASSGFIVIAPEFGDGTASITVLPDGTKKDFQYYKFAHGESEESDGFHSWRNLQLKHRAKEIETIMTFFDNTIRNSEVPYYRELNISSSLFLKSIKCIENKKLAPPILVGHSFGGATVFHLAGSNDEVSIAFRKQWGIHACITLDPWMFPLSLYIKQQCSIQIPLMSIHSSQFQWPSNLKLESDVIQRCKNAINIKIDDAGHLNYVEYGFLAPIIQSYITKQIGLQNPLDLLESINHLVLLFCEHHHDNNHANIDEFNGNLFLNHVYTLLKKNKSFQILYKNF